MKKIKKISLILPSFLLIIFLSTFLIKQQVSAQVIVNRETNREYSLNENSLSVLETRRISILDRNWKIGAGSIERFVILNPLDTFDARLTEDTIASISINSVNNSAQVVNIDRSDLAQIVVEVAIGAEIRSDAPFEVSISYLAYGLSSRSGLIYDIYIPGFSQNYQFQTATSQEQISTIVRVPKSLGEINFITPTHNLTEDNGNVYISFPTDALIGQTGWIQMGKQQIYSFNLTQIIPKTLEFPFGINIAQIILPRNVVGRGFSQEVFFEKILPKPLFVEEDSEGNIFASFAIRSNVETKIEISGFARVRITDEKPNGSNIELQNPQRYLEPGEFWEVDHPEIIAFAQYVRNQAKSDGELLAKLYSEVVSRIDYSLVKKYGLNIRLGALATLRGAAAVCMEYSDLFIATARALGMPARAAFGYGYSTLADPKSGQNVEAHQWVEVFWEGQWVAVDTTWGESGREIIGGNLNHFYTHLAYESPNDPSPFQLSSFGQSSYLPDQLYHVVAVAGFDTENLLTAQQVVELYPRQNELSESQIALSFIDLFERANSRVDEFLQSNFNINLPLPIISIPAVVILFFVLIKIVKKLNKRKSYTLEP